MKITINGYDFKPEVSTYPGGEVYVRIPIGAFPRSPSVDILVTALPRSSDDIMRILMVINAMYKYTSSKETVKLSLHLQYFPYARQDRVCGKGESFSLLVMCQLLETLDLDNIIIDDIHSNVVFDCYSPAKNLKINTQKDLVLSRPRLGKILQSSDYLVAPDKGSVDKIKALSQITRIPFIVCDKQRLEDGSICVTSNSHVDPNANLVIVDDICDGGGTFLAVGNCFAENPMSLIVTHGIFSKGKDILLDRFTEVEAVHDWTQL